MKSSFFILLCLLWIETFSQIGIGTTTPQKSSILDISSKNKGILIPRIDLKSPSDDSTITAPTTGLLVWNTGTSWAKKGFYYNSGDTILPSWIALLDATSSIADGDSDPNNENQYLFAGHGITLIQNGQNYEINNSEPDEVVTLTSIDSSINIQGIYPNFSLSTTDTDTTNELVQDIDFDINTGELIVKDAGGLQTTSLSSLQDHDWYKENSTEQTDHILNNIYTNGKVGIRNHTPTYTLDVDGDIRGRMYRTSKTSGNILQIGNIGWIQDTDIDHTIGIYSATDSNEGSIKMGKIGQEIIKRSTNGKGAFADAKNKQFSTSPGILIESGTNESGGFFANAQTAALWSAGNNSPIFSVYDEDDFSESQFEIQTNGVVKIKDLKSQNDKPIYANKNGELKTGIAIGYPHSFSSNMSIEYDNIYTPNDTVIGRLFGAMKNKVIDLGFSFKIGNITYTQARFSLNGWISFGNSTIIEPQTTTCLPIEQFPNATIFPRWGVQILKRNRDNLPATISKSGSAPNRRIVFRVKSCWAISTDTSICTTYDRFDYNVIINENGMITVNYTYDSRMSVFTDGTLEVIGFQMPGGEQAQIWPISCLQSILDQKGKLNQSWSIYIPQSQ